MYTKNVRGRYRRSYNAKMKEKRSTYASLHIHHQFKKKKNFPKLSRGNDSAHAFYVVCMHKTTWLIPLPPDAPNQA